MVLMLAAAMPANADAPAQIDGSVRDAVSRAPLAAAVTIGDGATRRVSVKTDRAGRFAALGFEPGDLIVSVDAKGYVGVSVTCDVPSGRSGRFEFELYPIPKPGPKRTISTAPFRCALEPVTVDEHIIR